MGMGIGFTMYKCREWE